MIVTLRGDVLNSVRAVSANERGRRAADDGRDDLAERHYQEAIDLDPKYEPAWFNLGLVYKRRRDWPNCRRCNLEAAELDPRPQQPAWWNLGIAATALSDWDTARRAWRGYGLSIAGGEGPISADFGPSPVRINPEKSGEVVWCRRIDPARAMIENVPLPESGHRHGDIVLHDGQPNGEREAFGRVFSVFDELEIWKASDVATIVARLECPNEVDARALLEMTNAAKLATEDWSASIRPLCKACSEGRPHQFHDQDGSGGWRSVRDFGFAGDLAVTRELLERWATAAPGRIVESLRQS